MPGNISGDMVVPGNVSGDMVVPGNVSGDMVVPGNVSDAGLVPGNVSDGFFRRHGLPRLGNLISLVFDTVGFASMGNKPPALMMGAHLTLTA